MKCNVANGACGYYKQYLLDLKEDNTCRDTGACLCNCEYEPVIDCSHRKIMNRLEKAYKKRDSSGVSYLCRQWEKEFKTKELLEAKENEQFYKTR